MNIPEFKTLVANYNEKTTDVIKSILNHYETVFVIGNGGSSSIAAHSCCDLAKFLNKKSIPFTDSNRLTCYANDFGYDKTYVKMLEEFYNHSERTLVILISSSGNSENIVNCYRFCADQGIPVGILTGFNEYNKLRLIHSELQYQPIFDYFVNSRSYATVEMMHEFVLHSLIDS